MRTVLHLIETSEPGGAERMLVSLVERLDPAAYRPVVCLLRDGWLYRELVGRGVRTLLCPLRRVLDPSWIVRCLRLIREEEVDLMHAHEFAMNTYGCMVARLTGIPIVTTVHGKGYYSEKRHRRLAYRFVARASFRMVAVSEDIRGFLLEQIGARPDNVVTIYNGIDPAAGGATAEEGAAVRRELGIPGTAPVIGTVGNLLPVKGHTYLLRATARLVPVVPDLAVLVGGRPILLDQLRAEARALGIDRHVHFLGFREDVPALLRAMDVFVFPSLSEGLSLSLLEAMAAGLPVVATDVGGNPEIVRPGETGFLVPVRDPETLADRILTLLRDQALARAFGEAGRERVRQRFSLQVMLRAYADVYAAALAAGRAEHRLPRRRAAAPDAEPLQAPGRSERARRP